MTSKRSCSRSGFRVRNLCLIACIGGASWGCDAVRSKLSEAPVVTSSAASSAAATAPLEAASVASSALATAIATGSAALAAPDPTDVAEVKAPAPPTPAGVVPEVSVGTTDNQVLDTPNWKPTGFPALSRDGLHVAWVFSPSEGMATVSDESAPASGEPDSIRGYPNFAFAVLNVRTGATERTTQLLGSNEYGKAQRQKSKHALAATVKAKLAAVHRELIAGGYASMASAPVGDRTALELDGIQIRVSATHLTFVNAAGVTRLAFGLDAWTQKTKTIAVDITCSYTLEFPHLAVDSARGFAIALVYQHSNIPEHCEMVGQADRQMKMLRLAP
jgi:hypothetical protein